MAAINVDIRTRVLGAQSRVYIVRPGAGYRLYQDVAEQSAILFDLPGLDLPEGVRFSDVPDLVAQIQRSQALRSWFRSGQLRDDARPSADLADYPSPDNPSDRRSLSQFRSIGRAFFERSKPGDLVLVPPLRFADPVLVGELIDDVPILTRVSAYGRNSIYGRRVKWLAQIAKNDVPSRVIEISQKPNSFVQLERSVAIWFYDRTYRSYVLSGEYQSELKINAEKFGATDDAKLSAFLNFVVANYAALGTGVKPLAIEAAMFVDLGEYEPDKRASINSPGELVVHALKITPLLFMTLLALRGCLEIGSEGFRAGRGYDSSFGCGQSRVVGAWPGSPERPSGIRRI